MTIDEIFAAIMIRVRALQPLYGSIYSMLPKREVEKEYCETMGVSSKDIVYNEEFVKGREIPELVFINLHEITHYALLHPFRLQGRNREIFNVACDLYVNALLISEFNLQIGKTKNIGQVEIKAPTDLLYSDAVDINRDSVESIYDRIVQDMEDSINSYEGYGDNGVCGKGNMPGWVRGKVFKDLVYADPTSKVSDIDKAKGIITNAVTKEKLAGTGSGRLLREIEEVLCEKVPWEKLVSKFLIDEVQKETSYRTTDYRMNYQEAIFPGNRFYDKSKLDKVKICIDTSGSVSNEELGQFRSAILQLLKKYKVGAELIYWDGDCESSGLITDKTSFDRVECRGNGGTTPQCLFEYFKSKNCKIKPSLVLILTDGYFDKNALKKYGRKFKNTLWLISKKGDKNFEAPFGTVSYLR